MTAFVILHYRAIDTTRSCVKSIRALAGDKHIVIVDNASPDGTGKQLAEEFAASPDVTVLLHGKNDGFAPRQQRRRALGVCASGYGLHGRAQQRRRDPAA